MSESDLVIHEIDLLNLMEMDPAKLQQSLGGKPFAIICPKGRRLRYKRLAEYLGLGLYENPKVQREDGFVLIHEGEAAAWLPNFRL